LRERRGWTQAELAEKAGIHLVTVSQLEAGLRGPSLDMAERLATALGMSITALLKPTREQRR
jgi:transcriptional regulator with XRE-family HTH domain